MQYFVCNVSLAYTVSEEVDKYQWQLCILFMFLKCLVYILSLTICLNMWNENEVFLYSKLHAIKLV